MGIGSCESTASSHRAHLQRSPDPSTYSDEPNSQEHKPGRIELLAKPMVQAAPDCRSASSLPRVTLLSSPAGAAGRRSGTSRLNGSALR
jgi:hypothetical protein